MDLPPINRSPQPFWETMTEAELVAHSQRVSLAVQRRFNDFLIRDYVDNLTRRLINAEYPG